MTAKLNDGSLDVAIALTEGLLAGIAKGHDAYKIVGTYVESPLCMFSFFSVRLIHYFSLSSFFSL